MFGLKHRNSMQWQWEEHLEMHMNCGCSVATATRGQKAHLRATWQGEVKNETSKSDHSPAPEPLRSATGRADGWKGQGDVSCIMVWWVPGASTEVSCASCFTVRISVI